MRGSGMRSEESPGVPSVVRLHTRCLTIGEQVRSRGHKGAVFPKRSKSGGQGTGQISSRFGPRPAPIQPAVTAVPPQIALLSFP